MSAARLGLVHVLLAALVIGSGVCIVADAEYWPFSRYSMYSHPVRGEDVELLRVYGVVERSGTEIPLVRAAHIEPFDRLRLRRALTAIYADRDRADALAPALRDCLRRYEALRKRGRHDGPPLQAVRLYELRWKRDPARVDPDRPDGRRLLISVANDEHER